MENVKVLFADPDRDLLDGYRHLLEDGGGSVATAFDGTQIPGLLGSGPYDLAVLNEQLPRAAHERLLHTLHGEGIPVIVLLNRPVHLRHLCRGEPAGAYLPFPFFPSELNALAADVLEKSRASVRLTCAGVPVGVEGFRFSGTDIRLTAGEIDILTRLAGGAFLRLPPQKRVYIHSLNVKLSKRDGPPLRIVYQEEKGYTLVRSV